MTLTGLTAGATLFVSAVSVPTFMQLVGASLTHISLSPHSPFPGE
jgi:hypothetical protein